MNQLNQRPIIALDFSTWQELEDFLRFFPEEEKLFVKIGMELFYQEGPEIVRYLKDAGHDVFRSETSRYSEYGRKSNAGTGKAWC